MNIEQLIEEGQQLMRPCSYLTMNSTNASLAALWGGSALVASPSVNENSFRHWLSLDCRFLPEGYEDLTGCLSVYVDEKEEQGMVVVDRVMQLTSSHASTGVALFACPSLSCPPINAIFEFGSPLVKEWMNECDWQSKWLYNCNFKDHDIVSGYEKHIIQQNPFFGAREDVFAMLGGWHESWPENDWFDLLSKRLVVFTYQNAEPWLEVWAESNQSFKVIPRIT